MRILIRTSKWAVWARRFGALALPLAALPVALHHSSAISSEQFVAVEAVAMVIAAIAVAMALIAFIRLWFTGDRGWARAGFGFGFGMICLLPAAFLGWQYTRLASATDVSTDFTNPPALVTFVEARFVGPEERRRIDLAYPNARARNYPIEAPQMFALAVELAGLNGWDLRAQRAPLGALDTGTLNAIVTTLLGFRQEVAIRIAGGADGTTIDMRSTALSDFPDFGQNGQRIEGFLLALDDRVTQILRNAPVPAVE